MKSMNVKKSAETKETKRQHYATEISRFIKAYIGDSKDESLKCSHDVLALLATGIKSIDMHKYIDTSLVNLEDKNLKALGELANQIPDVKRIMVSYIRKTAYELFSSDTFKNPYHSFKERASTNPESISLFACLGYRLYLKGMGMLSDFFFGQAFTRQFKSGTIECFINGMQRHWCDLT